MPTYYTYNRYIAIGVYTYIHIYLLYTPYRWPKEN